MGGYQIDTCLPFSLYLRHGFCYESEDVEANRVKRKGFRFEIGNILWAEG